MVFFWYSSTCLISTAPLFPPGLGAVFTFGVEIAQHGLDYQVDEAFKALRGVAHQVVLAARAGLPRRASRSA